MSGTQAVAHPYLEALLRGQAQLARGEHAWLDELRGAALDRANALTVPTLRDEDWRFTDLSPLYKAPFAPALEAGRLDPDAVRRFELPEAAARLVFVDGHLAPALSTVSSAAGVTVTTLRAAAASGGNQLRPHLGTLVPFRDDVFSAVNTAYLHDGAVVLARRNAVASGPIHLLFLSAQPDRATYARCLVAVEPGAECLLVEEYATLGEHAHLTSAVTEIAVGDNARMRQVRLQHESRAAFHLASCGVSLARDAFFSSQSVTLGGRISRYDLKVTQAGEGAQCAVDGLALISGRQLADTHSAIDHALPRGRSRQLHKCVAGGAGHAVFSGKILVRAGAQLTDSAQQSRTLLLSDKARVDTKPQLEIFADDVKCAHGATVGQLDDEQLFYLKSRGLGEAAARNLLTYAFAAEVVDRIPVTSLRARLEARVLDQTQTG